MNCPLQDSFVYKTLCIRKLKLENTETILETEVHLYYISNANKQVALRSCPLSKNTHKHKQKITQTWTQGEKC